MADEIDRMRIGYDEGELMGLPAAQRVNRGIILAIRDTVEHLVTLGWDRQRDIGIVPENEDGLPAVELRGTRVFEMRFDRMLVDPLFVDSHSEETQEERSALSISGRWLRSVSRPGLLLRMWRRMRHA